MDNIIAELKDINYGWKDKNNKIHKIVDNSFSDNYVLQSPKEVVRNKVGVCWDQVELERNLFEKNNISFNTYFIVYYDNDKCPTHTFLIYKSDDKYCWFEHSWEMFRGVHRYSSEKEALIDVKEKFIKREIKGNINPMNLCIYKYERPNYGISCLQFYKHCENGENIIL